jgi:hypothetical protein
MMKIKQIWDELENDKSFYKGLLIRRYSGLVVPDIFIGLQQPEKLYCIAASFSKDVKINIGAISNLQEIQLDLIPDVNDKSKNLLIFKLINVQRKDIFSVLCEDLISTISSENIESRLVSTLLNRFEKWKSLFLKINQQGLTPEAQRGLYGELYFLRTLLQNKSNNLNVLNSWLGPSKGIRDFQLNNWALEVKTTLGNNHQKIIISNERQLDTSLLEHLYLYHLSLENVQEGGESLPQIIISIQNILISDSISLNRFKSKLYEVGLFEIHYELYNNWGYFIRQANFYKVEGEFPRIQETDLRNGVGDVKYSIIVSQCQEYLKSEITALENIIIHE